MYQFYTNGEYEIIRKEDLPRVVEYSMGKDVANILRDLIVDSSVTTHSLHKELDEYICQREACSDYAYEAKELIYELIKYIQDAKRMNKSTIISFANDIDCMLNNIC